MKDLADYPEKIGPAHSQAVEEILQKLGADRDGLSGAEVDRRMAVVGANKLPAGKKESVFMRFFKHFNDTLIYVLIGAAVITGALGHWVDTAVIMGVVVINAIIGFIQEGKAEEALEGIRKMLSAHAHVKRDGEWHEIESEGLVPGDVIRLRSGDRVPADARLFDVDNLRVEESALTGESEPVEKRTDPVAAEAGVGDRFCMAFSGSIVASGRGKAVVTATGPHTEMGKINKMIEDVETLETPLTKQMAAFSKTLALIILVMAAVMFGVGWLLHDYTMTELFFAAIGFAVAAIPEGLPAVLTITLAIGVQRMAQRKAITRKLGSVETLGSVTVICSDKTGTLTRNEMTVRDVVTAANAYVVSGLGYAPEGEIKLNGDPVKLHERADLHAVVEAMMVCNDSKVAQKEGQWRVVGEPTEGALITLGSKAGFEREGYGRIGEVPFESDNKFMGTLNDLPGSGGRRIFMKGAPDRLFDRCKNQRGKDGATEALDRAFWEQRNAELGGQGLRVLAAAALEVSGDKQDLSIDDLGGEMELLGLVGIIDPPRPEAIEAIKKCHEAGIRVKMITGDHAGTATAIGREMGIGEDSAEAITGADIEQVSDEELVEMVQKSAIFARTSPEHKLRLVKALQAKGEVVAMTGDGVNDAPALKRADIGVAMGIKGTEATKEAADIVLADDNFASIERAVEEGRTIYDNLRKSILFILPTNGAEALVILIAVAMGWVLPLTPVQILWVNMVTAISLALALSFERAEPDIMKRRPRNSKENILSRRFVWRIGFVSVLIGGATVALFSVAYNVLEMPLALARTLAVNTLVCTQVFYLFNSRFIVESSIRPDLLFSNRAVWYSIGALAVLQAGFVYLPFMQAAFGSAPLALHHWLIAMGVGFAVFCIVELEKAVARSRQSKSN